MRVQFWMLHPLAMCWEACLAVTASREHARGIPVSAMCGSGSAKRNVSPLLGAAVVGRQCVMWGQAWQPRATGGHSCTQRMQALGGPTCHAGKEVCGGKCCDACNTAKTDCCNREFAGRHVHAGCGRGARSAFPEQCQIPRVGARWAATLRRRGQWLCEC